MKITEEKKPLTEARYSDPLFSAYMYNYFETLNGNEVGETIEFPSDMTETEAMQKIGCNKDYLNYFETDILPYYFDAFEPKDTEIFNGDSYYSAFPENPTFDELNDLARHYNTKEFKAILELKDIDDAINIYDKDEYAYWDDMSDFEQELFREATDSEFFLDVLEMEGVYAHIYDEIGEVELSKLLGFYEETGEVAPDPEDFDENDDWRIRLAEKIAEGSIDIDEYDLDDYIIYDHLSWYEDDVYNTQYGVIQLF